MQGSPDASMNLAWNHTVPTQWGEFAANISTHFESGSWHNFDHGLLGGPLTGGTHVGCIPYTAAGRAICEAGLYTNSYWRSDFVLTYAPPSKRWGLQAYVNNFTNTAVYEAGVYSSVNDIARSAPRTFGVRITAHLE
jgi:outer membrane receptor for monomeric catechols